MDDTLLGEEVPLLMLHLVGIGQRGVHVAVAVGVRYALHCLGRSLAESERSVDALHKEKLLLLAQFLPLLLFFNPTVNSNM